LGAGRDGGGGGMLGLNPLWNGIFWLKCAGGFCDNSCGGGGTGLVSGSSKFALLGLSDERGGDLEYDLLLERGREKPGLGDDDGDREEL